MALGETRFHYPPLSSEFYAENSTPSRSFHRHLRDPPLKNAKQTSSSSSRSLGSEPRTSFIYPRELARTLQRAQTAETGSRLHERPPHRPRRGNRIAHTRLSKPRRSALICIQLPRMLPASSGFARMRLHSSEPSPKATPDFMTTLISPRFSAKHTEPGKLYSPSSKLSNSLLCTPRAQRSFAIKFV